MASISAKDFLDGYIEELEKCVDWNQYRDAPTWTEFAKKAAEAVIRRHGLRSEREYFRVDVTGYEEFSGRHNWTLRVAFEHEDNTYLWGDELCKLSHVIADLRVIATFYDFGRSQPLSELLADRITQLGDRVLRYPGLGWLFIFGPALRSPRHHFVAYRLDEMGVLLEMPISKELVPNIWDAS